MNAFERWWDRVRGCNVTYGLNDVPAETVKTLAASAFKAGQEQAWRLSTPEPIPQYDGKGLLILRDEDIQAVAQRCKPELRVWIENEIAKSKLKAETTASGRTSYSNFDVKAEGNKTVFTYAGPLNKATLEAMRKDNDNFIANGTGAGAYGPYDIRRLLNTIEKLEDELAPGLIMFSNGGRKFEKHWSPEKKWHWIEVKDPAVEALAKIEKARAQAEQALEERKADLMARAYGKPTPSQIRVEVALEDVSTYLKALDTQTPGTRLPAWKNAVKSIITAIKILNERKP